MGSVSTPRCTARYVIPITQPNGERRLVTDADARKFLGDRDQIFTTLYTRNNKAQTAKNVRCFPHCRLERSDDTKELVLRHVEKGKCGSSVFVQVQTNQDKSSLAPIIVFSRFEVEEDQHSEKCDTQRVDIGSTIPIADLQSGVPSTDNNTGPWLRAIESTADSSLFEVNHLVGGKPQNWHYGWVSPTYKGSEFRHVLVTYVFRKVDNEYMHCDAILSSSPFQLMSSRAYRIRKRREAEHGVPKTSSPRKCVPATPPIAEANCPAMTPKENIPRRTTNENSSAQSLKDEFPFKTKKCVDDYSDPVKMESFGSPSTMTTEGDLSDLENFLRTSDDNTFEAMNIMDGVDIPKPNSPDPESPAPISPDSFADLMVSDIKSTFGDGLDFSWTLPSDSAGDSPKPARAASAVDATEGFIQSKRHVEQHKENSNLIESGDHENLRQFFVERAADLISVFSIFGYLGRPGTLELMSERIGSERTMLIVGLGKHLISDTVATKLRQFLKDNAGAVRKSNTLDKAFCRLFSVIEFEADQFLASAGLSLRMVATAIRASGMLPNFNGSAGNMPGSVEPDGFVGFVSQMRQALPLDDVPNVPPVRVSDYLNVAPSKLPATCFTGTWRIDDDRSSKDSLKTFKQLWGLAGQMIGTFVLRGARVRCDGENYYSQSEYSILPEKFQRFSCKGAYNYNGISALGISTQMARAGQRGDSYSKFENGVWRVSQYMAEDINPTTGEVCRYRITHEAVFESINVMKATVYHEKDVTTPLVRDEQLRGLTISQRIEASKEFEKSHEMTLYFNRVVEE